MKKQLLTLFGAALIILNVGVIFCPDEAAKLLVFGLSAALGAGVIVLARCLGHPRPAEDKKEQVVPVAAPPKPKEHSGQSGAEAIALLGLLQEHGRLVDFASEDISGADDADLGPAARVVHAGCSKVLREYFTIEPIRAEAEGANVTLDAGCDMASHRLLGSVPDQPPYEGVLVHPGWKATEARLPQLVAGKSESSDNVIAPAEIQIKPQQTA